MGLRKKVRDIASQQARGDPNSLTWEAWVLTRSSPSTAFPISGSASSRGKRSPGSCSLSHTGFLRLLHHTCGLVPFSEADGLVFPMSSRLLQWGPLPENCTSRWHLLVHTAENDLHICLTSALRITWPSWSAIYTQTKNGRVEDGIREQGDGLTHDDLIVP